MTDLNIIKYQENDNIDWEKINEYCELDIDEIDRLIEDEERKLKNNGL